METYLKYIRNGQLAIWDKGLAHIAGNVNGKTTRQLPVVTEVSALYRRKLFLDTVDGQTLAVKEVTIHSHASY